MKPQKFSHSETTKIDLGNKVIFKYPIPTRLFDISHMVVHGRHPHDKKSFGVNQDCVFAIYVIKGKGRVFVGEDIFTLTVNDVVFVPQATKYAVEGEMEYITFDTPAFYPEQSEQLTEI